MAKRKYTKRSEYWGKFNKTKEVYVPVGKDGTVSPDLLGEPFYTADASYNETTTARRQTMSTSNFGGSRTNRSAFVNLKARFCISKRPSNISRFNRPNIGPSSYKIKRAFEK